MNVYEPPDPQATVPEEHRRWPLVRRVLANKRNRWIAAAVLTCSAVGAALGLTTSHSATAAHVVPGSGVAGGPRVGGSNARSGPAAGGASGTVDSVAASSFTMSTSAGQNVTVGEVSSTSYENGTTVASASAVATGETVLVLGTVNGTTIT